MATGWSVCNSDSTRSPIVISSTDSSGVHISPEKRLRATGTALIANRVMSLSSISAPGEGDATAVSISSDSSDGHMLRKTLEAHLAVQQALKQVADAEAQAARHHAAAETLRLQMLQQEVGQKDGSTRSASAKSRVEKPQSIARSIGNESFDSDVTGRRDLRDDLSSC